MNSETLKLGIIERLMRVQKESTLLRMDQLVTQAEMEARAEESIDAIAKGEVLSLEEFSKGNRKWTKENYTK